MLVNVWGERVSVSGQELMVYNYIGTRSVRVNASDATNKVFRNLVAKGFVRVVERQSAATTYCRYN